MGEAIELIDVFKTPTQNYVKIVCTYPQAQGFCQDEKLLCVCVVDRHYIKRNADTVGKKLCVTDLRYI